LLSTFGAGLFISLDAAAVGSGELGGLDRRESRGPNILLLKPIHVVILQCALRHGARLVELSSLDIWNLESAAGEGIARSADSEW
jgi:hypothetical protein